MLKAIASIVAFAFACRALPAQSAQQTSPITIQVMDITGALFPGATIRITSPQTGAIFAATADYAGKATFNLPPGTYNSSIKGPGFKEYVGHLRSPNDSDRLIEVKLDVAPTDDPMIFIEGPPFRVEYPILTASIPLVELESLNFLPERHIRKHRLRPL